MSSHIDAYWLDRMLIEGPNFALCTSQALFDDAWARLELDGRADHFVGKGAFASCHTFVTDKLGRVIVVCIDAVQKRTGIEVCSFLVHEATHVWQGHRDYIGEQYPGREVEAYSIQRIFHRLADEYARQVKP